MTQEQATEQLDAIHELRVSPGALLVAARLAETINREIEEMLRFGSDSKTDYIRGRIAGMRTALGLADILESEAKGAMEPRERFERY